MLGVSVLRNQHLANIFYHLRLIEAYGTGMLKILECYADSVNQPQITITSNAFRITLPNMNFPAHRTEGYITPKQTPALEKQKAVLQLLDTRDSITRKEIETTLNISQASAVLLIREMLQAGQLIKSGNGRNVRYRRK